MGASPDLGSASTSSAPEASPELIEVVAEIHDEVSNFSTYAAAQTVQIGIAAGLAFILIFIIAIHRR